MINNKINILFILPSLSAGGAERVISFVSQNIDKDKFTSFLLITGNEKDSTYRINDAETTFLNKHRVLHAIPGLIWFLIKKRPQIVVSSIGHLNTVMGLIAPFFYKIKFIIREASVVSTMGQFYKVTKLRSKLSKFAFKQVDAIICQSKDMASDFQNIYQIPDNKLFIINNPITQNVPIKKKLPTKVCSSYITVGRLSIEKGHERIIRLLSQLDKPFKYTIIGDGPEKETLFNQIHELELGDHITHIPYSNQVNEHLKNSDLFLQGSYVEGFPNAVLESCAVGTPVLAFDVPGGTKEILTHELNGFLVKTENEFLKYLNVTKNWRPKEVSSFIRKRFDKNYIIEKYENLFKVVLN